MTKEKIIVNGRDLVKGSKVKIYGKLFEFDHYEMSSLHFKSKLMSMQYPDSSRFEKRGGVYYFYDFGQEE